jgi:co-chaperonin GroES (HSP10)
MITQSKDRAIIPAKDRIILQKIKEEDPPKTGSLILPNKQPKQPKYLVIASGSVYLSDNDVVYVENYKGVEITIDDQVYLVVKEEDVVAFEPNGKW